MEQKFATQNIFQTTDTSNKKSNQMKQKHSKQSQISQEKKEAQDYQSMVGVQAQNVYLLNYINKLEFLLAETISDRKREKKQREKQLKKILKCVNYKAHICEDSATLHYYLGITQGENNGDIREKESDLEDESNSDMEQMREKIYALKPKELQSKPDPLISLLTPLNTQMSIKSQNGDAGSNQYFKSEKDLKMEFSQKEDAILEKYEKQHKKEDYLQKIEEIKEQMTKGSTQKQERVEEFLKEEWKDLAKDAKQLVGNFQD